MNAGSRCLTPVPLLLVTLLDGKLTIIAIELILLASQRFGGMCQKWSVVVEYLLYQSETEPKSRRLHDIRVHLTVTDSDFDTASKLFEEYFLPL